MQDSKSKARLVAHVVPVREPALKLLWVMLKRYPDFEYQAAFADRVEPSDLIE